MISFSNSIIALVLGYFLGSIPSAHWLAKYYYGINIFEHGSGNMGATNIYRVLGSRPFAITLMLDIIKGFLAVLFISRLPHPAEIDIPIKIIAGSAAVAGHTLSFWVNFRGGKGVATALGVFLGIAPISSICAMFVFLLVLVPSGYVSLSSMVSASSMPFFIMYFHEGGANWYLPLAIFSSFVAVFLIIKHKNNIMKILSGKELSLRNKPSPSSDPVPDPTENKMVK
ncbi:MAG: glycerol-3-phosphate 1-O-acyltransferase PlsY [Candidatus Riflebacteria bacterium]|nr:glycerol-3-phosphate 1-O-acyltransferase PlsY [Candidatus Riflebacteria bacterium]